jgi:glycosyltransferase involved in cell wall biosynthesis
VISMRRPASALSRAVLRAYVPGRTGGWPEFSRLFVVGDDVGWSIDDDTTRLTATATRLGYDVASPGWARFARRQSVFHPDHFGALRPRWLESSHRLGLSYFHGRPGTPGFPEFDDAYAALRGHARRIDRVQVTHAEMEELVLSAGVSPDRVFRIPIGVELNRFPLGGDEARSSARTSLGLPQTAFVVGSFQKDGVGLGEGLRPKLIKGPDVFVQVLERLRDRIPELYVLLTGLARGYVRQELDRIGVPHRHLLLPSRAHLAPAYHALDVYAVTSRQEGGPKAVLEAMATGVPLVATRVGQTPELVVDGQNGILAEVDDIDALATGVERIRADAGLGSRLREHGRLTAEQYADERLDPRWAKLLEGFVHRVPSRAN